jgi:voltage-gated potassium channel
MPGDKIIKEGDMGHEMFLIVEGNVEVVGKKSNGTSFNFILKKGEYFGEVALISNSRRTSDVNAVDFCLLESLHQNDYKRLQIEFPGIKKRLKQGLNNYMTKRAISIHTHIRSNPLFKDISSKNVSI